MRRISTGTKVTDKFGTGKHGFTNGNAVGGIAATDLEDVWFDHIQEEIANVIEGAGITLDPNNRAQLLAAIQKITGGRLLNIQVFTANGTYTPTAGTGSVIVEAIGGGGGSGGTSATASGTISVTGGGGAGAYARTRITSGFSGVAVTVGAGGVAGAAGAGNGGTGGTTSFGAFLTCNGAGGSGGRGAFAPANISLPGGGAAQPSSGNIVRSRGKDGGTGLTIGLGDFISGVGGDTPFGPGATAVNATGVGQNASTYGAGAGGAASGISAVAQAGGKGGDGVVIVYEFA